MDMFHSVPEWWGCVKNAASHLLKGVSLILKAVLIGITSLSLAMWRLLTRWVGNYPSIAIGGFLVAVFLAWLVTFVTMRSRAVGAEAQRDSIAWQFTEFKERYGYE